MAKTRQDRIDAENAIIDAALDAIRQFTADGTRSWSAGDQSVDNEGYIAALNQRIAEAQHRITTLWQMPYMVKSRKVM